MTSLRWSDLTVYFLGKQATSWKKYLLYYWSAEVPVVIQGLCMLINTSSFNMFYLEMKTVLSLHSYCSWLHPFMKVYVIKLLYTYLVRTPAETVLWLMSSQYSKYRVCPCRCICDSMKDSVTRLLMLYMGRRHLCNTNPTETLLSVLHNTLKRQIQPHLLHRKRKV